MAEVKYTQKMFYEEVKAAMSDNPNVVAMCEKKLAQLDSKSSKTDTKKSTEQRTVMDMIVAVLCNADKPMKCGDIVNVVNAKNGTDYSSPKINAMLRKMLPPTEKNPDGTGEVVRTEEKKDVFFSLAE